MSRPAVSVVMPFAGSRAEAETALGALHTLNTGPDDQLILADNSGVAPADDRVTVVSATGEQSPSHARNTGAMRATCDWILFLDADCRAPADLLDLFFHIPPEGTVGALAGAVIPAGGGGGGVAVRYGAAKSFLDQDAHLAHPFMPRAVAANLLVRREAFEAIGGFYEGVRAAEDTDFSWRLQRAGWRLEGRPAAAVEHRYRTTVRALRRQWRGYAAGRAWLGRRYDGFAPQPAVARARRVLRRRSTDHPTTARPRSGRPRGRAVRPSAPRRAPPASPRCRPRRDAWIAVGSWRWTRCWGSKSWRASRSPTARPARPGRPRGWCWWPTASPPVTIRWPTSRSRWRARAWRPRRAQRRWGGAPPMA